MGSSLPGPLIDCSSPFPTLEPSISSSSQASVTNLVGSAASRPSRWGPVQAPPPFSPFSPFRSGSSTASTSSTLSSFVTPSQRQFRWGSEEPPPFTPPSPAASTTSSTLSSLLTPSAQAPVQPSALSQIASSGYPGEYHFSSPFGPTQDFANTGVCASTTTTPNNPFPGFSVDYLPTCPSNLFGPNPQTTTPVSGVGTERGSRYPRYAPTPDLDSGAQSTVMSISASNTHGHKSHEELRWEDYKNGYKGGDAWFSPAHKPRKESRWDQDYKYGDKGGFERYPPPDHSLSVFARPQMRTIDLTHRDLNGFPIDYNTPTAFQRPHELASVSSPASACTACGATSSSTPSVHLGLNSTTNPPSSATSLPGLFFPTYGSCPLLFATPNLAAHGITTTPAVQVYAIMFGTPNFTSQGTTAAPAVQAYPIMFGIPTLAGQGTTATPAVQPYHHSMFGTPCLAAQGTTTTPAVQPYHHTMFGTPSLAAQGTTTTPAAQPYSTMFGTQNLEAQGTTTTPAAQPYHHHTMFGTPNLGAQCITPAAHVYPVNGLNLLPFSLQ